MHLDNLFNFDEKSLKAKFKKINWDVTGKVVEVIGIIIEAKLSNAKVGSIVEIERKDHSEIILGEVVGFKKELALILAFNNIHGIAPGDSVRVRSLLTKISVGDYLLGQVVDPFLDRLDGNKLPKLAIPHEVQIDQDAPNPMERERIKDPLSLGVRALDGMLTFGKGQRIGIMAGSGVGKSVLMGMIARNTSADVNVIALIGERGREVREFIEKDLGEEGLARSIVITVTSDQSPLMRIRGAKVATAIAEYFSAQGKDVMLMMDSLTRVAMAQREIGNAIGEPPTTKGYTPSVFSLLPRLLERAGPQVKGKGSISGLYTVLVDGDDFNDPVADTVRSILDGHINLSRRLASFGHFPAIEVETSASRIMHDIVSSDHWKKVQRIKELIATYQDQSDLLQIGAYQEGANPTLDIAINLYPFIQSYLKQDMNEKSNLDDAINGLDKVLAGEFGYQPKLINEAGA